MGLQKVGQL